MRISATCSDVNIHLTADATVTTRDSPLVAGTRVITVVDGANRVALFVPLSASETLARLVEALLVTQARIVAETDADASDEDTTIGIPAEPTRREVVGRPNPEQE